MASPVSPHFDPTVDLAEIDALRSKILSTANRLNAVLNETGAHEQFLQPSRGRDRYRRDMSVDAVLRQLEDTFPSLPNSPSAIAEGPEFEEVQLSSHLPDVADCLADKLAEIKTYSRKTSRTRAQMGKKDPPVEAADRAMQHCISVLDVFARRERHRAEVLNGILESVANLVYPVNTSAHPSSTKSMHSPGTGSVVRVDSAHGEDSHADEPLGERHLEQMNYGATKYTEDRTRWVGDLIRCTGQLKSIEGTGLVDDSDSSEEEGDDDDSGEDEEDAEESGSDEESDDE